MPGGDHPISPDFNGNVGNQFHVDVPRLPPVNEPGSSSPLYGHEDISLVGSNEPGSASSGQGQGGELANVQSGSASSDAGPGGLSTTMPRLAGQSFYSSGRPEDLSGMDVEACEVKNFACVPCDGKRAPRRKVPERAKPVHAEATPLVVPVSGLPFVMVRCCCRVGGYYCRMVRCCCRVGGHLCSRGPLSSTGLRFCACDCRGCRLEVCL